MVLTAEIVATVIDPVVDLELDPGRRENIERSRGDERLAIHQLAADRDRVRLIEQIGPVVRLSWCGRRSSRPPPSSDRRGRCRCRRRYARFGPARGSPTAPRTACGGASRCSVSMRFLARSTSRKADRLSRPICQSRRCHGQNRLRTPKNACFAPANDDVAQRDTLAELVAQPMGGARAVNGLAGAVQVPERPELVGRVPRIESKLVYLPLGAPASAAASMSCRGIVRVATRTGGETLSVHSTDAVLDRRRRSST